jgi:hypothetical protein
VISSPAELSRLVSYAPSTIRRLAIQYPHRLPPAVLLGEPGKRRKKIWLRATVLEWLKDREERCEVLPGVAENSPVPATGRGPGRPRKLAARLGRGGV